MITEAQKLERMNGIGASDAPIITGHSTFQTSYELYKLKRGELEPKEAGERADIGNIIEGAIAEIFTLKTGTPTAKVPDTVYHPDYPHIFCHLDRTFNDGIPLEIKNTTQADQWGHESDGPEGLPIPVYIQVLHQMMCTGKNMAAVACLLFGSTLKIYEVPRDDELIQMILEKELKFWDCVQSGAPPRIEFNHSTTYDLLKRVYRGTDATIVDLPEKFSLIRKAHVKANLKKKQQDAIIKKCKSLVLAEMGESAIGRLGDGTGYNRKENRAGNIVLGHSKYVPRE